MASEQERRDRVKEEVRIERELESTIKAFRRLEGHLGFAGLLEVKGFNAKRTHDGWRYCWKLDIEGERFVSFIDVVDFVKGFTDSLERIDVGDIKVYPDKYA